MTLDWHSGSTHNFDHVHHIDHFDQSEITAFKMSWVLMNKDKNKDKKAIASLKKYFTRYSFLLFKKFSEIITSTQGR